MAETFLDPGVELIRWLVTFRGPALDAFFVFVTNLGSVFGYLILLPLVWWGVSWKLGARILVALVLSVYLNALIKDVVGLPRPFRYADVPALATETLDEYSFPSGHAQTAAVVWCLLALHFRKLGFTLVAVAVVLAIGFSRVYLGVHFPTDVLAGWSLGAGIALGYTRVSGPVADRVRRWPIERQLALAIGAPALLALVYPTRYTSIALGGLAGALGGLGYAHHRGLYPEGEASRSRRAWLAVGLVGLPLLYFLLRALSPGESSPLYHAYLFLRFASIGLWVSFLVPEIAELVKRR